MFDKTIDYKDYFPEFIDENAKLNETRRVIEEITELFGNKDLFEQWMVHKLGRLLRLLNQFEDIVFLNYVSKNERVSIIKNIWGVISRKDVSINTKIRFGNILTSHINNYKKLYLRQWWHPDFIANIDSENNEGSEERGYECMCKMTRNAEIRTKNCICGIIDSELLVNLIEEECTSDYMEYADVSSQKKRNYITCLSRILGCYRPYILDEEVNHFVEKWLSMSVKNISFFVYSKLFLLICNQRSSFKLIESGHIFEIWGKLNGQLLNYWDSLMITIFSRGIKYSWTHGICVDNVVYDKIPLLFEILYLHMNVPILHNVVSNSINTGTTSSTSSVTTGSVNMSVLQPKVPSIVKEVVSNEVLSAISIKPVNIYNKFSIIFVHLLKSLSTLESGDEKSKSNFKVLMERLQNLINILYPLSHPLNTGKWSHSISIFIQALTYQYCKRIYRERRMAFLGDKENKETVMKNALCRFDDEYLLTILFPLLEQGIYSKDIQVAGRYEDSLKRWAYILPDILLDYLINIKIIPALEVEAETNQVYVAFRLLSTITPLIMQFSPDSIPRLLDLSLNGVDITDPMKINQALLFYTVLFYYSQNVPVKNLDFDEYEVIENISDSLENGEMNNYLSDIAMTYTLYNYPKGTGVVTYSSNSLESCEIPKSIVEYTNIDNRSPLKLYFSQCLGEYDFILDHNKKADFYYILNKRFTKQVLLDKYSKKKVLIDTIFGFWIYQFMERVFNILGNVIKPAENESYSSSVDLGISYALRSLVANAFSKCKLLGFDNVLRDCYASFANWIDCNYYPDNYKHLSKILSGISSCDPELSFCTILEKLLYKIMVVDGDGRSNAKIDFSLNNTKFKYKIKQDIQDEAYFLYYVNLISSLIRYTNASLLKDCNRGYYYLINSLISSLLLDSRKRIKRAGIKLQERLIESLLHLQVVETGSGEDSVIRDEREIVKLVLMWGHPFYLQESSVFGGSLQRPNWYVPNRESLSEVRKICVNNMLFMIRLIRKYMLSSNAKGSGSGLKNSDNESLCGNNIEALSDLFAYYNDLKKEICGEDDILSRLDLNTEDYEQSNVTPGINTLLFCLNNIRIINKSVSSVFSNVNSSSGRSYTKARGDRDCNDEEFNSIDGKNHSTSGRESIVLLISEDSYLDFGDLFFRRYFEDSQKIILYLSEMVTGLKIVSCKLGGPNDSESCGWEYYYRLEDPLVSINSTEEIKFKLKLIKTINQTLNHYYSSTGNLSLSSLYNTSFSDSVLSWLSYTNGLYYQSSMLNSPRVFWLKNIQYFWNKRINMTRHEYRFTGYHKKLMYLLALYSIGNYNIVRKSAQTALKESTNSHLYSRNDVIQFIFFEVYVSILLYENKITAKEGGFGKDSFEHLLFSNLSFIERKCRKDEKFLDFRSEEGGSDNSHYVSSESLKTDNIYSEHLFNNLSGFSFIIMNNSSLQRLLWNNFELLLHYYTLNSYVSSLKMSKENVIVRVYNGLYYTMNNRDYRSLLFQFVSESNRNRSSDDDRDKSGNSLSQKLGIILNEVELIERNELIFKVVDLCLNLSGAEKRGSSICCQLLKVFVDELNSRNVFKDGLFLRRSFVILVYIQGIFNNVYDCDIINDNDYASFKVILENYWDYLWRIVLESNRSSGNLSFYSVIFRNLTLLLKLVLEKDKEMFVYLVQRESNVTLEFNMEKVRAMMENLANVCGYNIQISHGCGSGGGSNASHSGSRGERKSLNTSNPSTCINNMVLSYNSMLNPFPYHRIRCYSNAISLNDVVFIQHVLILLYYKWSDKGFKAEENGLDEFLNILIDWSNNTNIITDKEKHIVILEFLSALFSVSTYSDEFQRLFLNKCLNKDKINDILSSEFQHCDQDFVFNLMDCIKYSLNPLVRQKIAYYYSRDVSEFQKQVSIGTKKGHCEIKMMTCVNKVAGLLLDFISNPFNLSAVPSSSRDEHFFSTFETIKHLRMYQTGLIELIMNNNDNLGLDYLVSEEFRNYYNKGLALLENVLSKDNNYKQLREEISNMLHTLIISCNIVYTYKGGCDFHQKVDYISTNLLGLIGNVLKNMNSQMDKLIILEKSRETDTDTPHDEDYIKKTNDIIPKIEIILYYCLIRHLYSSNDSEIKSDQLLPFDELLRIIFKLQIINNNNDIFGLSYNSLMSLLLTILDISQDNVSRFESIIGDMVNGYVDIGNFDGESKQRRLLVCLKIRINTIIGEYYSLLIYGSKLQLNITNNIIYGLFEENMETICISKQAFCTVFKTLPFSVSVKYIKLFMYWILKNSNIGTSLTDSDVPDADLDSLTKELQIQVPEYLTKLNGNSGNNSSICKENKSLPRFVQSSYCRAGINGLISIVLSHPFDIPFWLPKTLTFLANCVGRDVPHALKKQIQECIQEFFKTHQDGWNIIHKHKFSDNQLEILDIYKGRPTYFT